MKKKALAAVLVAAVTMSMAGCGSKQAASTDGGSKTESEADMKYIKDQMGNRNTSDISPDSGVIVSLSAESTNLQLTEAQIKMQAQQDAELETDQTMSGDTDTLSQGTSAAYTGASAQTAPAAGQSPVENINISI